MSPGPGWHSWWCYRTFALIRRPGQGCGDGETCGAGCWSSLERPECKLTRTHSLTAVPAAQGSGKRINRRPAAARTPGLEFEKAAPFLLHSRLCVFCSPRFPRGRQCLLGARLPLQAGAVGIGSPRTARQGLDGAGRRLTPVLPVKEGACVLVIWRMKTDRRGAVRGDGLGVQSSVCFLVLPA